MPEESICVTFKDNNLLPLLFGEQDKNLNKLEEKLSVTISSRGNAVSISGAARDVYISESVLKNVYKKLQKGMNVNSGEFDAVIRMLSETMGLAGEGAENMETPPADESGKADKTGKAKSANGNGAHKVAVENLDGFSIRTLKNEIVPYSNKQTEYMKALMKKEMVFAAGPAGTGKTYLAVAAAVNLFQNNEIDRIILSRPAVEAGEKIGFLPGDMREKVDPYLRPLYDALYDMMPAEKVVRFIENGQIEIAPLAFMRGRTLRHSCVILDEAQNSTPTQMKMFLTRLGEGSRMAITGDLSQTDLPRDVKSGFRDAIETLGGIEEVKVIEFEKKDIVRHALTLKIVQAYEERDNNIRSKKGGES